MKSIQELVALARMAIDTDAPYPGEDEVRMAESELGVHLPDSYREFVRLGGIAGLRIGHRVLSPSEMIESRSYLPDQEHVPFADNGCGDFYCWPRTNEAEPVVLFADHETGYTYSEVAPSFAQWLEQKLL